MIPNDYGEWVPCTTSLKLNVCIIIRKRRGEERWEYQEEVAFVGEWNDLVDELYRYWHRFHLDTQGMGPAAKYDKLDELAQTLAHRDMPYEFMLPDGTDEEYVAYVKPIVFHLGIDGKLY